VRFLFPRSHRRRRSAKRTAVAGALIFVVVSPFVAWNYFVHNEPWRTERIYRADAVVTEIDRDRRSDGATVEFTDRAGRRVVAETRVRRYSLDEGERVQVEYTAGEKRLVRVAGYWRPAYRTYGPLAAIGLVAGVVSGIVHLVRRRR